jgi:hypothetical protein
LEFMLPQNWGLGGGSARAISQSRTSFGGWVIVAYS